MGNMFDVFQREITNPDVSRSNMFSVSIGCGPGSRLVSTFDGLVNPLFEETWVAEGLGALGLGTNLVADALDDVLSQQASKWLNTTGGGRRVLAAMNSRVVESFLGQFSSGLSVLDFFSGVQQINTSVVAVRIPEMSVNHQYKTNDTGGRTHKFGTFAPGYLTVTFRQTPGTKMYQVFQDYFNMVANQGNNTRHFFDDVKCDISVNEHARSGLPHTSHMFAGCVPVRLGELSFSYENNNEILVFEVDFAFKSHYSGALGRDTINSWAETFGSIIAAKAGDMVGSKLDSMIGPMGSQLQKIAGFSGSSGGYNSNSHRWGNTVSRVL